MATDSLSTWKSTFKLLQPQAVRAPAIQALADWIDGRVTSKLILSTVIPSVFTWNKTTFYNYLVNLPNSQSLEAVKELANAWALATTASTMAVSSGAYVGIPTPATIFSAVFSCSASPGIIASTKATLTANIASMGPVGTPDEVKLGEYLRVAFLTLTYDVTGLNSLPLPASLVSMNTAVA